VACATGSDTAHSSADAESDSQSKLRKNYEKEQSMSNKNAVYFFCNNLSEDPVALHVYDSLCQERELEQTDLVIDGNPVQKAHDRHGNTLHFVRIDKVLSHDYPRYLPMLQEHFGHMDFAGVVNWHEGANAPENILCAHTTADIPSGAFGTADPKTLRNLLIGLDKHRKELSLDDFTVLTEATHWSGIPHGGDPMLITEYKVPVVDIEIGSSPECWNNSEAAKALGRSLFDIFDTEYTSGKSLLCVGGMHFDSTFRDAVFNEESPEPLLVSHILPNQWVVSGAYDNHQGLDRLHACVQSIVGGVDGIVFHDKLKGNYKERLRELSEELSIPIFKHKALRNPSSLPFFC